MKRMHKWIAGGITFLVSAALVTPSTFAAKALNDEDMDQATAKGQSAVLKDESGSTSVQTIDDMATAKVALEDQSQQEVIAGDVINAAGENNVAVGVNAASTDGGDISQENNIDQNKASTVDMGTLAIEDATSDAAQSATQASESSAANTAASEESGTKASSAASSKSFSLEGDLTLTRTTSATSTEAFPDGIDITGDISSASTANGNGDSTSTSSSTLESTSTSEAVIEVDVTKDIDGTKNTTIDNNGQGEVSGDISNPDANELPYINESVNGGIFFPGEQDNAVDAEVTKTHEDVDLELDVTKTKADGDAAIADSDAEGHNQSYAISAAEGKGTAKSEAELEIDLPVARNTTSDSDLNIDGTLSINVAESAEEAATEERSSSSSSSATASQSASSASASETHATSHKDNSQMNLIVADHVKIGNGDQNITDETEYDVTISDDAQRNTTALNIINVAGRNNIASAWNLASSNGGTISVSPFVGSGDTLLGTITQVNTIKQVN